MNRPLAACWNTGLGRAAARCEQIKARSRWRAPWGTSRPSNTEVRRRWRRPKGLGRRGAVCCVASPRRYVEHRLRRRALHPTPRRSQRDQTQFSNRLLAIGNWPLRRLRVPCVLCAECRWSAGRGVRGLRRRAAPVGRPPPGSDPRSARGCGPRRSHRWSASGAPGTRPPAAGPPRPASAPCAA